VVRKPVIIFKHVKPKPAYKPPLKLFLNPAPKHRPRMNKTIVMRSDPPRFKRTLFTTVLKVSIIHLRKKFKYYQTE
jgi:hypothetical protein